MARRHYSDETRAAALAVLKANGGNVARTARETDVPEATLREWRQAPDRAAPTEVRAQKEADLADLYEAEIRAVFEAAGMKRGDASWSALMVGLGILTEKHQLVRGEPTERHAHTNEVSPEEAVEALQRRRFLRGKQSA